ncbi:putative disease resistance protein RGA3 [Chenopodium quinoa]|uniref:putative disease resistance protein RGA3 n=1 Tax=Chenopodium quinoa TaxID=63459 RepID=UPI000B790792|nr:putative disease resistance protein RGA3 [Chenopodium quinoa]
MSRQVKDIKEQLDTIVSNHHKFGLSVDYNPICRRREETCSYVDAGDIIGREDDKKVVIDMLLGPNDVHESFRFVTIVGVGGLGKTALAQLVYNDNEVEAKFPDPKLKVVELVSGKRPDDTSSMEFVQKQFQEQLREKKYLLVLDDVWNEDCEKWRNLCRFLILGQEAFDKGEHEHANHLELVEIGKKIVEKCYNIPLAIKVVGSLLFGQHMNKWQTFEHSGFAGIGKGDNEIMSILKLSYHNLRPSLKNCFSYCALFPKDYRLKRKELISLWIAQGYIASLDRDQSIEDAAEEHFLILVRRCFFQDVEKDEYGDIEYVKMHDVAQEVGREEIGVVSSNTTKLGDKVRHVNFARGTFSQSYSFKSKIRSLISRGDFLSGFQVLGDSVAVDAQIDSWIGLRVLCLQSIGIKRLDSIGNLLHLRYLDLSNSQLQALSDSITRLHNLQTLDLTYCIHLRELPKDFSKLVKLRYLDLSGCSDLSGMPSGMDKLINLRHFDLIRCDLSSMPSGMGKLTNLRVLPLFVVGMETRVSTEEQCMGELKDLKPLTNLKGGIVIEIGKFYKNDGGEEYLKGLKYLTKVEISFLKPIRFGYNADEDDGCLEWEDVMEKLEPPSNLKIFSLCGYMGTTIPWWGRALDNWALSLPLLVEINLLYCKNLEQIPSLSKLCNLKSLRLEHLKKLEYMENTSSNNANEGEDFTAFFPSLKLLYIHDLGSLKGWWREDDDDDDRILRSSFTFPRLSELDIINCPKLTSFPSRGSLEDLGLDEVDCFGNSQGNVVLRELLIDDGGLLNLINSPVNELHIFWNEKVESLSEYGDVFRKYKYTSYLRSLRISHCSNLRRLGRGGLEHLTALESLEFIKNDQLSFSEDEVDDDGMPWKSLQHCLRSLSINNCRAIKSLPESMRNLASLQNLVIVRCPEIQKRCKEPDGEDWPKIQRIPNQSIHSALKQIAIYIFTLNF